MSKFAILLKHVQKSKFFSYCLGHSLKGKQSSTKKYIQKFSFQFESMENFIVTHRNFSSSINLSFLQNVLPNRVGQSQRFLPFLYISNCVAFHLKNKDKGNILQLLLKLSNNIMGVLQKFSMNEDANEMQVVKSRFKLTRFSNVQYLLTTPTYL